MPRPRPQAPRDESPLRIPRRPLDPRARPAVLRLRLGVLVRLECELLVVCRELHSDVEQREDGGAETIEQCGVSARASHLYIVGIASSYRTPSQILPRSGV